MNRCVLTIMLCWPSLAYAQTPEPPVVPDVIHLPQLPAPTPPPAPSPGTVANLPADVMYVITASKPFFVFGSLDGIVKVLYEAGPVTIRGKFVEHPETVATRKFTDHYIAIVEAYGSGRVELIVIPSGVAKETDIIRRLVDCQIAPLPPPSPPTPPVPPTPTNPFQTALQAAYGQEIGDKANQVKTFANFYRNAAATTVNDASLRTYQDLQDVMKIAVKKIGLPVGSLSHLVPVIAQDEMAAFPIRSTPLDTITRDKAKSEFIRIAAALEGLR